MISEREIPVELYDSLRQHSEVGGFCVNEKIRGLLDKNPDLQVSNTYVGNISLVFGRRQSQREPAYSVYYRQQKGNATQYGGAGASTPHDAINGLGVDIGTLVRWEFQKLQEEKNQ